MYLFQKQGRDYKIVDKEWKQVRDQLVSMRVNGGFPYITVNDGDYMKNGELYLKHWYEDVELDLKYLEKVLPYVHQLWGRTVHLESIVEGVGIRIYPGVYPPSGIAKLVPPFYLRQLLGRCLRFLLGWQRPQVHKHQQPRGSADDQPGK